MLTFTSLAAGGAALQVLPEEVLSRRDVRVMGPAAHRVAVGAARLPGDVQRQDAPTTSVRSHLHPTAAHCGGTDRVKGHAGVSNREIFKKLDFYFF